MSSVELMNRELDFLEKEIPGSIEHYDWTHEVFPEELREIYDPEEVTIRRRHKPLSILRFTFE
jgi:hypothetical protein